MNPLSKEAVRLRQPGNKYCSKSGELREVCEGKECVGWRAQRDGKKAQNRTARNLQRVSGGKPIVGSRSQLANEEWWRGMLRLESKQGKQVNPIVAKFVYSEAEALVRKSIGDSRPFVLSVQAEGMTDQIWCFRFSEIEKLIDAFVEAAS